MYNSGTKCAENAKAWAPFLDIKLRAGVKWEWKNNQ